MAKEFKPAELARLRLQHQRLLGERWSSPLEVLRAQGAIQAQEYAVAKWSLAQRSANEPLEGEIDALLAAGKILRTHVLRPTWHFVTAEDLRWIVTLTAPRVHAFNAYYYRKLGLDEEVVALSQKLLKKALSGGKALERKQISEIFAQNKLDADGLRFTYFLMRAELDLLLCSGPMRGKQQTYALLDERAPLKNSLKLSGDEALAELARRYFSTRGPATAKDFAWWSSLTLKEIKRAVELAKLSRLESDGLTYFYAGELELAKKSASPRAHLLQGYDEYVIAYSESRDLLNLAGRAGIVPPGKVQYTHAVTLDGQVVGHWRRDPKIAGAIEAYFAEPLSAKEERAVEAEKEAYRRFFAG